LHATFLRSQGADYYLAARELFHGRVESADLSPSDRTMLAYAEKLTSAPATISDDEIALLHAIGFNDAQVWEMTFTISIFAMFNRMADAFGLDVPTHLIEGLERV
jgi:uncharacterized peroxidase-related enzyme